MVTTVGLGPGGCKFDPALFLTRVLINWVPVRTVNR